MGTRGRLAEKRRDQGLTQQGLAEKTQLALRTIQKIEAGQDPSLATAKRIALVLGVSIEDIWPAEISA